MSRRRRPKPTKENAGAADSPVADEENPVPTTADLPSIAIRRLLSVWLPLHLFALLVSLTAIIEPSTIQANVLGFIRPYLQVTHFDLDDRPLYLAHGDPSEQPHLLQVTRMQINSIERAESEPNWDELEPGGFPRSAVAGRYARWLSTAAAMAEQEQPGLVAELLSPVAHSDESIEALRIVRLPTELNAESLAYSARVIHAADQVSLVQLQWTRLSAVASQPESDSDD